MRSAEEVLEPRSTSMATFPHINRRALRLSCTDSDNNKNTTNSRHRRSSSDNAHPPHTAPIWCDNRQHTRTDRFRCAINNPGTSPIPLAAVPCRYQSKCDPVRGLAAGWLAGSLAAISVLDSCGLAGRFNLRPSFADYLRFGSELHRIPCAAYKPQCKNSYKSAIIALISGVSFSVRVCVCLLVGGVSQVCCARR